MIAALYVQTNGVYYGLPNVDPWDIERDARRYAGPWPVVAHPPCARWCKLAGFGESMGYGKKGEDGGCFAAALDAVRRFGGVLEHPAYSHAWKHFGLIRPARAGWAMAGDGIGWTCHVDQGHYGHKVSKPTWLYAVGPHMPLLRWGRHPGPPRRADHDSRRGHMGRLWSTDRIGTPIPFRDVLIAMAEGAAGKVAA